MVTVYKNDVENRFEASVNGRLAVLDYKLRRNRLVLIHTGVPDELAGQGIGSALAKAALSFAQEQQLTIKPYCPFVKEYIERHPEYQSLL